MVFGTTYSITYQYHENLKSDIEGVMQQVDNSLSPFNKSSVITAINNNTSTKADKYLTRGTALAHYFPWMKEFNGDDANGKKLKQEYDKLKKEWEAYNDIDFSKPAGVGAETTKMYNEQVKWDDIVEDGMISNILREVEGVNREWNRLKKEDKESEYAGSEADDYLEINGKEIAQYKLIGLYKKKFGALKRKLNGTSQDEAVMDEIRELRTRFIKNIKNDKLLQQYAEEELK